MKKIIVLIAVVMAYVYSLTGDGVADVAKTTTKPISQTIQKSANESGKIIRVKDGDTYVIDIDGVETTVRLIGIDTPESVHQNKKKNIKWGKKVSDWVKKKLKKDTEVTLEYDVEPTDIYGRTLAYVYLDGVMFNKTLIKKGYARAVYYKPNGAYKKEFEKLQKKAKKAKKGFWKDGYKKAFPG